MAFDQLLAALEREASGTADRLLADAHAEAERISAQSEHELAQRRSTAATAAMQQQRAELEREIAAVARTARRDTFVARDRWLDRVFATVGKALPGATLQEPYRRTLPKRLAAAVACFDPSEPLMLRCSATLLPALQALVAEQPTVSLGVDEQAGSGFRLANVEGLIEVDESLESRLEHTRALLARMALQHLEQAT